MVNKIRFLTGREIGVDHELLKKLDQQFAETELNASTPEIEALTQQFHEARTRLNGH